MAKDTVGIKNNNYLNVKNNPSNPWNGIVDTDPYEHAVFDDPAYGIRAAIINLRTYWFNHNLRTILGIIRRWAPEKDTVGSIPGAPLNQPDKYAQFVSDEMGLSYSKELNLFDSGRNIQDKEQIKRLIQAMAEYENYRGFQIPDELFERSFQLL